MFLLNVLQHDAENDENLANHDNDLVSENQSECDKEQTVLKPISFSKLVASYLKVLTDI